MVSKGFQRGLKPCGFRGVSEGSETVGGFRGVSEGSETVGGFRRFQEGFETLGENARNVCMIRFESYRGSKLRIFMAEICPDDLFCYIRLRLKCPEVTKIAKIVKKAVPRWFQRGFRGVSEGSEILGVFKLPELIV